MALSNPAHFTTEVPKPFWFPASFQPTVQNLLIPTDLLPFYGSDATTFSGFNSMLLAPNVVAQNNQHLPSPALSFSKEFISKTQAPLNKTITSHKEAPQKEAVNSNSTNQPAVPLNSKETFLETLAKIADKEREVVASPPSSPLSNPMDLTSSSSSSSDLDDEQSSKRKEGLEDATEKIVTLLQTVGQMKFKELHETLGLNYRRAYDILNVLSTTPLVSKRGKKREHDQIYLFFGGQQFSEAVNLKNISTQTDMEYQRKFRLEEEIQCLKKKLVLAEAVLEESKS